MLSNFKILNESSQLSSYVNSMLLIWIVPFPLYLALVKMMHKI